MSFFRRLIAWLCFLGLLTAVGVPAFFYVRYTPRHIADGRLTIEHLSADGRWLLTSMPHADFNLWENAELPNADQNNRGYLQVWDVHRGRLERVFDIGLPIEKSPDGRQFICCQETGKLLLIDWQAATSSEIPWEGIEKSLGRMFSTGGRWLVNGRRYEVWPRDWPVFNPAARRPMRGRDGRFLGFIHDDRYAVCCGDKHRIDIVDLATEGVVVSLNSAIDLRAFQTVMLVSPDGRWLMFGHGGPDHPWKGSEPSATTCASFHCAEVWDWKTASRRLSFDNRRPAEPSHEPFKVMFAKNGSRLATWQSTSNEYRLAVFDLETDSAPFTRSIKQASCNVTLGDRVATVEHSSGMFSPDGKLFLFTRLNGADNKTTMFEVAAGSDLWEKPFYSGVFSGDGACVACRRFAAQERLEILDPGSGEQIGTFTSPFITGCGGGAIIDNETFHRRSLVVLDGSELRLREPWFWERWLEKRWPNKFGQCSLFIRVANVSTGADHFRCRGNFFDAHLSDDGSTLVASEPLQWDEAGILVERRIVAWDVHPHRACFWATTWAAGVGVVLLVLRRWRLKSEGCSADHRDLRGIRGVMASRN